MKNIKRNVTAIIAAATAVMCAGTAVLGSGTLGLATGFSIEASAAEGIGYINAAGENKAVTDYTVIKSTTKKLTGGWYVVNGKTQINDRITVTDDSYIILTDGAKLTVTGGIKVASGVKFNVYTQMGGSGSLYAGTTNGSNTRADDGDCGIGGSGAKVYIVGGNVYAKGGSGSYGIQGSDIRLYWTNPGDSVYASSYSSSVQVYSAFADEASGAAYYSSKVSASALKGATLKAAYVVDKNTLYMEDGVYAVFDNIKVSDRITVSGDVDLFLADGGTLTADDGIDVSEGNSLDIYGNGGKLYAGTRNGSNSLADDYYAGIGGYKQNAAGDIRIFSGAVYANGGKSAAGIGGDSAYIEINGGKVVATGGRNAAGIGSNYNDGGCEVKVLGGNVSATGGINGAGIGSGASSSRSAITLSYTNTADSIYASSYNGTVKFLKTMYTNSGKVADTSNIDGSTIAGAVTAYTVSFETNGGTYAAPQTVAAGSKLGKFPTVTRSGYTLVGWYTDRNFYTPFSANSAIYGNITLYAKWEVSGYTVSFETNGGSYVSSKTVVPGRTIGTLPTPTRSGYVFDGWYTDRNFYYEFNPNSPINGDMTLYAKWSNGYYTVTFNAVNGWFPNGNASVEERVKAGYSASSVIPADPAYADGYSSYEFVGWYYDKNGNTRYTGQAITKNTTLYAIYNKVKATYRVSFNANGGSFSGGQKTIYRDVDEGKNIYSVAPSDPYKANSEFIGWYYDAACTISYDGEGIYTSMDLYAGYDTVQTTVTLSFECNGGTPMSNMYVSVGESVPATALPFPTRAGYTFDGWYTNATLTRRIYDSYTVTGNATLYAGWIQDAVDCRISFVTNGGSGANTMYVTQGDVISATDLPFPTRSGYTFDGWYMEPGLYNRVTSMEIVSDTTLYAGWEQDAPLTHTVSFYVDGSVIDTQIVNDGERARNNYSSYNWGTRDGTPYNFNNPVYSDTNLYAIISQTTTYTVSFFIDGSFTESQTVEEGGRCVNNYPYLEWYTAEGTLFDVKVMPVTRDLNLFAYTGAASAGSTFGGAGLIAAIAGGVVLVGGGVTAAVVASKKKKNNSDSSDKSDK